MSPPRGDPRISEAQRASLDELGFVVLPDRMDADLLAWVAATVERLFEEEGEQAGAEFKQEPGCRRLANLANKGECFLRLMDEPRVLPCVRHVLSDSFKLSSLNARSVNPRSLLRQPLHADMGAVMDERGAWVCNVIWMLDDFTESNGPLRVVPGSHRLRQLPQDALSDPLTPHPDEQLITGVRGSMVVLNAHLWHGGQENRTDSPRTAVHAFYCRRDKPQQQYQRQLLHPDLTARLTAEQRHLLALDDPENDRLARQPTKRSGFLK